MEVDFPALTPSQASGTGQNGTGQNGKKSNSSVNGNGKRPRVHDSPEKEVGGGRYVLRIAEDMNWAKDRITAATARMEVKTVKDLAAAVQEALGKTLIEVLERNASTVSDMAAEMLDLNSTIMELEAENTKLKEEIGGIKAVRQSMERKQAIKEAEEKVANSARQCKLLNVNVGGAHTDRKVLVEEVKKKIKDSVRSDLRKAYESKIAKAVFTVIAKQPEKRTVGGIETWTVPTVITMQDKETKWEVEDIFRQSKMSPAYHWPKEMLEPVSTVRKIVASKFSADTHYIRIRPEERDGQWRIRADVKDKNSSSRFQPYARWSIPPLDPNVRAGCQGWLKPIWVQQHRNNDTTTNALQRHEPARQTNFEDFADDFTVSNFGDQ
jgi:hypothetical protein